MAARRMVKTMRMVHIRWDRSCACCRQLRGMFCMTHRAHRGCRYMIASFAGVSTTQQGRNIPQGCPGIQQGAQWSPRLRVPMPLGETTAGDGSKQPELSRASHSMVACTPHAMQGGQSAPARQRTSRFMGVGASNRAGQWQVTRIRMRSCPVRAGPVPCGLRWRPGGVAHHA